MANKEFLIQYRRLVNLRTELDKYELKNINKMLGIYDKAISNIERTLKTTRSFATKAQQRALLGELSKAHAVLKELIKPEIVSGVKGVSKEALKNLIDILSWDGKDKQFNSSLDRAASLINSVSTVLIGGALLAEWVDKIFDDTLKIQKEILASNLAGQSYRKMYNNLMKAYPDVARKELINLARTYNQSVIVEAQEKLFEDNKDIMKSVEWSAVMEIGYSVSGKGTCARCAALDGTRYEEGESRPYMPLHVRCRCMWIPVTLTWNELFKKHRITDKDGENLTFDEMEKEYRPFLVRKETNIDLGRGKGNIISAEWTDKNYGDYITGKGGKQLESVVGPTRAKLIEDGLIKFSDIVDLRTGKLLTLKELGYKPISKGTVETITKK